MIGRTVLRVRGIGREYSLVSRATTRVVVRTTVSNTNLRHAPKFKHSPRSSLRLEDDLPSRPRSRRARGARRRRRPVASRRRSWGVRSPASAYSPMRRIASASRRMTLHAYDTSSLTRNSTFFRASSAAARRGAARDSAPPTRRAKSPCAVTSRPRPRRNRRARRFSLLASPTRSSATSNGAHAWCAAAAARERKGTFAFASGAVSGAASGAVSSYVHRLAFGMFGTFFLYARACARRPNSPPPPRRARTRAARRGRPRWTRARARGAARPVSSPRPRTARATR